VAADLAAAEICLDLAQSVGTTLRGHSHDFLTVGITAIYLVFSTRRIAKPVDDGSARENIVHE
jgi:hypothetical protein